MAVWAGLTPLRSALLLYVLTSTPLSKARMESSVNSEMLNPVANMGMPEPRTKIGRAHV